MQALAPQGPAGLAEQHPTALSALNPHRAAVAPLPCSSPALRPPPPLFHPNSFNYCAQLPLRSMLPLYAFVGMLCAEAFCCASDIHPLLEDVYVEGRAIARLDEPEAASGEGGSAAQPSPDQATLVLLPAAVSDFIAAADDAAVAAIGTPAEAVPARRGGRGGVDVTATLASGRVALLADYAAGVTEAQRAQARLAAGGAGGLPYVGLGLGASPPTGTDDLLDRSRVAQQLHRLLYAEAVLGQLFQRCEDISDGLEATSQVLRFMAKGLDEVRGAGQDGLACGWCRDVEFGWAWRAALDKPAAVNLPTLSCFPDLQTNTNKILHPSSPHRSSSLARCRSRCRPRRRCMWSSRWGLGAWGLQRWGCTLQHASLAAVHRRSFACCSGTEERGACRLQLRSLLTPLLVTRCLQLRDAQYALAAADCAQLALMLAVSGLGQILIPRFDSSPLQPARYECSCWRPQAHLKLTSPPVCPCPLLPHT